MFTYLLTCLFVFFTVVVIAVLTIYQRRDATDEDDGTGYV